MLTTSLTAKPASGADNPGFRVWLRNLRAEALAAGISQPTLDKAFKNLKPIPRVIELDRSQPEFKLTLKEYLQLVTPASRAVAGRKVMAENRTLLQEISRRYGVQPPYLVALWGIESSYGKVTGGFPVIGALATLAYDGRRGAFFRRELLQALEIIDAKHISTGNMRGSWAGAMGQVQFMPSTFQRFAVDYDGNGRIDIWWDRGDALASAANYLARCGWNGDQLWGREVFLPKGFDHGLSGLKTRKRLREWATLGVLRINGRDLPQKPNLPASLVKPDGPGGRAFLVYGNYRALLKWNRSHFFAVAVGTLADRIRKR